jgi:alpha-L-rhamnosidase
MNSLNHSPFTHVSEFFYEVLAGIRIGDAPVTDHVTLAPALIDDLDWAEASVETPNGPVASAWERTDAGYELRATVPWNGAATVRLPGGADAVVTESGTVVADGAVEGVRAVESRDGALLVDVGAGEYDFVVERGE